MKNGKLSFLLLVSLSALAAGDAAPDTDKDVAPGLVAEYFEHKGNDFPNLKENRKPFYVRVEKQVNYEALGGDSFGIKLEDHFYARWNGILRVEKAGEYQFFTASDDGSRLFIDGKMIVENGGIHPSTEKSGRVELKPGDHVLKVDYFEGGGEGGCIVSWHPPGGQREVLPEKVLFHKKGSEKIEWDKVAWEKNPKAKGTPKPGVPPGPNRHEKMNYGPYLTGNIESEKGSFSQKGLAIKLGTKEKPANILFDTDLLRVQAAWSGGYLRMPTGRDGLEGHPSTNGSIAFGIKKAVPGWAKAGDFADPRPKPTGPLPHDWARYKGLYLNGESVILSYTVGGCPVLEMPGFTEKDGLEVFTRSFNMTKSGAAQTLLVCERDGATGSVTTEAGIPVAVLEQGESVTAAALAGAPPGSALEAKAGRIEVKLPAQGASAKFQVLACSGPKANVAKLAALAKSASAPDLEGLTKGGPPRWPQALTTVGTPSTDAESGYVADQITVPYENPWESYMRTTGVDFFADGRAAVSTISGDVWIVSGIDDKLANLSWRRFATGMFQPLGLKIEDGKVYVLCRDQITRLHDLNNDGEADYYEAFTNDGMLGDNKYHEFAHDLHTDKEGNFYYMRGSNLGAGGTPHNGCMMKVSKDGSKIEPVGVGFRAPNGMGVGPNGELTSGDNQGNWVPASPINWIYPPSSPLIKKGELCFCGFRLDPYPYTKQGPRIPPLVWLPHGVDNSCGGQAWAGSKWGPFSGALLHMSYGKSVLFHVMKEQVGDYMQGAVVKIPLSFISGIMRARVNPADGQLYVTGMRGWQTNAQKEGGLYRIRYTGKPVHMPLEFHVTKTGVNITFTEALDAASANDGENYGAEWFHIEYTNNYGSPEFNVTDPKKKGREALAIKSVKLQPDGKTVALEIPGLKVCDCLVIKFKIKAADGFLMSHEVIATINQMP